MPASLPAAPPDSSRQFLPQWRLVAAGALLALAILAAYANSLRGPFVYDDVESIANNPGIRQLWPVPGLFVPAAEGGLTTSGRPVLALSLALNHRVSGSAVWSYHAFNAAIHAGAALLLFGLVRRTLAPRIGPDATGVAAVVAALWALHPLQTQAVTYTVQRAESLMGFFFLLTVYAFARSATAPRPRPWLMVSATACLLGMGTKEAMATAPLLVLLYDRTFAVPTFRDAWRRRRGYYVALGATWLVLGALIAATGGNRGGTVGLGVGVPLWSYPITQFEAIARYLALSVWPQALVFEYGTRWVRNAAEVVPYLALAGPLVAATLIALRRWPAAGFCGAWFFAILAPTSLAPGTIQMIVEHRMYLPLAAVVTLAVVGAYEWFGRRGWWLGTLAAVAIALLTVHRNQDYRSAVALWGDTVAKRPDNPRARDGFATALADAGRLDQAIAQGAEALRLKADDAKYRHNHALRLAAAHRHAEAIAQYEIALRFAPDEARIHNNLAVALVQAGRPADAVPHYRAALRQQPNDARFHYNHGLALMRLERFAEAADEFEATLRTEPGHADARFNLATAMARLGRMSEALAHYQTAAEQNPGSVELRTNFGGALLVAGRASEALQQFQAILAANPEAIEARYGLAGALGALGRPDEAIATCADVLHRAPNHANTHFKLANLLSERGKLAEAVTHYETALRLVPDDAEAHHNLGLAFARLERFAEAGREFETALRLRPDYADAQRHLAQLRTALGRQ